MIRSTTALSFVLLLLQGCSEDKSSESEAPDEATIAEETESLEAAASRAARVVEEDAVEDIRESMRESAAATGSSAE